MISIPTSRIPVLYVFVSQVCLSPQGRGNKVFGQSNPFHIDPRLFPVKGYLISQGEGGVRMDRTRTSS